MHYFNMFITILAALLFRDVIVDISEPIFKRLYISLCRIDARRKRAQNHELQPIERKVTQSGNFHDNLQNMEMFIDNNFPDCPDDEGWYKIDPIPQISKIVYLNGTFTEVYFGIERMFYKYVSGKIMIEFLHKKGNAIRQMEDLDIYSIDGHLYTFNELIGKMSIPR